MFMVLQRHGILEHVEHIEKEKEEKLNQKNNNQEAKQREKDAKDLKECPVCHRIKCSVCGKASYHINGKKPVNREYLKTMP